jgi:DNA-binding HxlR family transcriptional regulator
MRQAGRSGCPINMAVEAFGDRRSLLVLRDIMFGPAASQGTAGRVGGRYCLQHPG